MHNLRQDIIPILYIGGTGGNFLSAFLFHARESHTNWESLSEVGDAHLVGKDSTGFTKGIKAPSIEHINALLEIPKSDIVKYPVSHCSDVNLSLTYFNKIIKTYFDEDDFYDLARVFTVKWGNNILASNHERMKLFNERLQIFKMPEYQALRTRFNSPRVLNISWKDLMYNDPMSLVTMLSEFTSLPVDNFPTEQLMVWRALTEKTIGVP